MLPVRYGVIMLQAKIRGYIVRRRVAALRGDPNNPLRVLRDATRQCLRDTQFGRTLQSWLPGQLSTYERLKGMQEENEGVAYLQMSKLSTALANERTLLAWTRTTLAIMRTAFATLGIEGTTAAWVVAHSVAVFLITTLMIATCAVGVYRYYKIKKMLMMKSVPSSFKRQPMWPLIALLGAAVATIAAGAYSRGIEK